MGQTRANNGQTTDTDEKVHVTDAAFTRLVESIRRMAELTGGMKEATDQALDDLYQLALANVKPPGPPRALNDLMLEELRVLAMTELEADVQGWKILRQLRSHLERKQGLSPEQALARIAEMAGDGRARGDVSTRSLAVSEATDRFGRDVVRQTLNMTRADLRRELSRARCARRPR